MSKSILALGASSFIGRHFVNKYSFEGVIPTYNLNKLQNGKRFNSLNQDLADIIDNPSEIKCAIIFLGDTKPTSCIQNTDLSNKLNVDSIIRILIRLKQWGIKPIFISTEFVFDGQDGNYSEESRTNPIVLYGKQKKQIEDYIHSNFSEYLIFRLAKVFGVSKNDNTIFTNWMESLNKNHTILCAEDQRFSPIYVGDVIDVIYQFSKSERKGIYNLGGQKAYTRLELLKILMKERSKFIKSRIDIQTCKFNSFDLGEEWPVDVSLNVEKIIKSTNIEFMSPIKACELIVKSYQIREK